jgi:hypothetical protein
VLTATVQRQIYIDSFAFTLLVPDPDHDDGLMPKVVAAFDRLFPDAQLLTDSGRVSLQASQRHCGETIGDHMAHHPERYGGVSHSASSEFSAIIGQLVRRELNALVMLVTAEEIAEQDTSQIRGRLLELIATREAADAARQRVNIITDAFDDDPREIWDVPEAKAFFRKLFDECPFIFFLAQPGFGTVRLFAACCCRRRTSKGRPYPDKRDLDTFLKRGFRALNQVTQGLSFSHELNVAITDDVFRELGIRPSPGR